ncbi:MAG: LEA type 2 family protein [Ginsengibacter sp.]
MVVIFEEIRSVFYLFLPMAIKFNHNLTYLSVNLVLLFFSCSTPKSLEYRDYHNLTLEKLGFSNSRIKLELEYFNPNNFGLQLRRTDMDVYINNNLLGHSSSDTLINIPRKNSFILPINFEVNMQNVFKNAWNSLSGNEVIVKVEGNIKVGKANVFMSMPVRYEGKQTFSLLQ